MARRVLAFAAFSPVFRFTSQKVKKELYKVKMTPYVPFRKHYLEKYLGAVPARAARGEGTRMAVAVPSWSALFTGQRLAHTAILTAGVWMHVADSFLVASILPSVVEDIGGAAFYTWSAMLYTVSGTLGTACGGYLAATYGMRQSALIGIVLVLVGNAGGALSPTMAVFLVARVVQGAGGGVLVAQSYEIASAFYPDSLRPRVLTMISVAHGAAALTGPIVGGAFAMIGWWRGAFWATVPVLAVLAALIWRFLPSREPESETVPLPVLRLLLLAAAVLSVAVSGQVPAVTLRLLAIAGAAILVTVTLRLDTRAASRLFPSRPLSIGHTVGAALWIVTLITAITGHTGVLLPLVVQVLHGASPLFAGYFQSVLAVSWTTCALLSARFEGEAVRRVILLGPLLVMGGVLGQACFVVQGPLVLVACSVAMTGAGMGLAFAHINNWTMAAARADEAKVTASSIPTMSFLGRGFGAATAGLVANAAGLDAGVSSETVSTAATWVYGLAVVVPAVIVALSVRLVRFQPTPGSARETSARRAV